MKWITGLVLGFALGVISQYLYLHSEKTENMDNSMIVNEVLENAAQMITAENNSCGTGQSTTVGRVFSNLTTGNMSNRINRMEAGCVDLICTISISYCKPWQSSECNQTFLKYETRSDGTVIVDSFQCIDIP